MPAVNSNSLGGTKARKKHGAADVRVSRQASIFSTLCPISQSLLPRKVMLRGRLSRGSARPRSNAVGKGLSYGSVHYISGVRAVASGVGKAPGGALDPRNCALSPVPLLRRCRSG